MRYMRQLAQMIVTYRLLIAYIAILAVGGILGAIVITRPTPSDESAVRFADTRSHLTALADGVKAERAYSQLPEGQRQAFLERYGRVYAIDSRVQSLTPDTLRAACVERSEEGVVATATHLRATSDDDEFKNYISLLAHAKAVARANCYVSFDPIGKEDVPPIMAHP